MQQNDKVNWRTLCGGLMFVQKQLGFLLTIKWIFNKALNLFEFDFEFMLESVPGTNQY